MREPTGALAPCYSPTDVSAGQPPYSIDPAQSKLEIQSTKKAFSSFRPRSLDRRQTASGQVQLDRRRSTNPRASPCPRKSSPSSTLAIRKRRRDVQPLWRRKVLDVANFRRSSSAPAASPPPKKLRRWELTLSGN